jgi:hypothetical protein
MSSRCEPISNLSQLFIHYFPKATIQVAFFLAYHDIIFLLDQNRLDNNCRQFCSLAKLVKYFIMITEVYQIFIKKRIVMDNNKQSHEHFYHTLYDMIDVAYIKKGIDDAKVSSFNPQNFSDYFETTMNSTNNDPVYLDNFVSSIRGTSKIVAEDIKQAHIHGNNKTKEEAYVKNDRMMALAEHFLHKAAHCENENFKQTYQSLGQDLKNMATNAMNIDTSAQATQIPAITEMRNKAFGQSINAFDGISVLKINK